VPNEPPSAAIEPPTVAVAVERALAGLAALGEIGEGDEDAWSYVVDLVAAWRTRLEAVAAARGAERLTAEAATAIATALDEASRISDPYRAIDWCSTLPQVVLTALGEVP
jgi:hypothetical protein